MKLSSPITGAKGVNYSHAPQRSPEWLQLHSGRIGASRLYKWMERALVKNKETGEKERTGAYLKGHADIAREIQFEKAFGVPFNMYVTQAMLDGIANEDFVREQYEMQTGFKVERAGAFFDEWSIASPDGLIGEDGGCEIKWLQDNNSTEVLETREPLDDHYYQIQGNLRLSGRTWWDYIPANPASGRFLIIRIFRDEALIAKIDEEVRGVEQVQPLSTEGLFQFSVNAPLPAEIAKASEGSPWG